MPKKNPPKAPRPTDRMASMAGEGMHAKDRQKRELSAEVLRARNGPSAAPRKGSVRRKG